MNKLQNEYINFKIREKLLNIIESKERKEWNSIIEYILFTRILYSYLKKYKTHDGFYHIDDNEKKYIERDIKYYETDKNKKELSDKFINIINNREDIKINKQDNKIRKIQNNIIYKDLKFPLDTRLKYLIKRTNKKTVLRMLLRYSGLGISGQHCALPINVYDYLYDNFNIRGEGYSSPLNSKLITKKDTKICTLFYDTDKYFGSVGIFSSKVLIKYSNFNWTVNPPYLTNILKYAFNEIVKAIDEIENKNFMVIFVSPKNPSDEYNYAKNHKYTIECIEPELHLMNCNGRLVNMNNTINSMMFVSKYIKKINKEHIEEIKKIWNIKVEDKNSQSNFEKPIIISNTA